MDAISSLTNTSLLWMGQCYDLSKTLMLELEFPTEFVKGCLNLGKCGKGIFQWLFIGLPLVGE